MAETRPPSVLWVHFRMSLGNVQTFQTGSGMPAIRDRSSASNSHARQGCPETSQKRTGTVSFVSASEMCGPLTTETGRSCGDSWSISNSLSHEGGARKPRSMLIITSVGDLRFARSGTVEAHTERLLLELESIACQHATVRLYITTEA
eukprot:3145703-Rhodomonas_salina.2